MDVWQFWGKMEHTVLLLNEVENRKKKIREMDYIQQAIDKNNSKTTITSTTTIKNSIKTLFNWLDRSFRAMMIAQEIISRDNNNDNDNNETITTDRYNGQIKTIGSVDNSVFDIIALNRQKRKAQFMENEKRTEQQLFAKRKKIMGVRLLSSANFRSITQHFNNITIDKYDKERAKKLHQLFHRLYIHQWVRGIKILNPNKNVIALFTANGKTVIGKIKWRNNQPYFKELNPTQQNYYKRYL